MSAAIDDYQRRSGAALEAARAQYRVQRRTVVRSRPDVQAPETFGFLTCAAATADQIDRREREIEAMLASLDETDARWLLSLIRARFGRVEATTREQWVRAKR